MGTQALQPDPRLPENLDNEAQESAVHGGLKMAAWKHSEAHSLQLCSPGL